MVTISDILDQIVAAEKIAEGRAGLQPWWTAIATKALGDALRDINMVLAGRRLTATQIQSWADYDSALLNQALYWCFTEGSALLANVPEEAKNPDRFDMRKWLATATLLDGSGNAIKASSVGFGKITGGYADASSKNPSYPKGPFLDQEGGLRRW
jgi:hypothetical protein